MAVRVHQRGRSWISALAILAALVVSSVPQIVVAADPCSCVTWVESQTGLPGGPDTAANYTPNWMKGHGYKEVEPTNGAIVVWSANTKKADRIAGHMAIVYGNPSRDSSTHAWTVQVRQADWLGKCPSSVDTFHWPDLSGLHFYVRTSPKIAAVSSIAARPDQRIVIKGGGFGSHAAYTGDTEFLEVSDMTRGWAAGWHRPGDVGRDTVTLAVVSWADSLIVIGGYSGAYGYQTYGGVAYDFTLLPGDQIRVRVWNPATSAGPATFFTLVTG